MSYQAKVIGGSLNLRVEPSTAANIKVRIPDGSEIIVVEDLGEWSRVRHLGLEGYVMSAYIVKIHDNPDENTVSIPKADLEKIYDIIGDWLGLRG